MISVGIQVLKVGTHRDPLLGAIGNSIAFLVRFSLPSLLDCRFDGFLVCLLDGSLGNRQELNWNFVDFGSILGASIVVVLFFSVCAARQTRYTSGVWELLE